MLRDTFRTLHEHVYLRVYRAVQPVYSQVISAPYNRSIRRGRHDASSSSCGSTSSNSNRVCSSWTSWGGPTNSHSTQLRSVAHATDGSFTPQPAAGEDSAAVLEPALYVVATPIGNLEDISFRALRILRSASLILAEDTRHTRKLLEAYSIRTPTLSCHEHNERQRQELVISRLKQGEAIALVSDAGMPAISDPGALIVAAAVAAGVRVVPVPGPCAAIAALAAAGLPTDSFYFAGFLPPKSGKRRAALQQLKLLPATLVFYAPPHGLAAILADMVQVLGQQRQAVVARELTKLHEEFFRCSLQDMLEEFGPDGHRTVKGEVVLLVAGCSVEEQQQHLLSEATRSAQQVPSTTADTGGNQGTMCAMSGSDSIVEQLVAKKLASGSSISATAKELSQQLQMPRSKLYKVALRIAEGRS